MPNKIKKIEEVANKLGAFESQLWLQDPDSFPEMSKFKRNSPAIVGGYYPENKREEIAAHLRHKYIFMLNDILREHEREIQESYKRQKNTKLKWIIEALGTAIVYIVTTFAFAAWGLSGEYFSKATQTGYGILAATLWILPFLMAFFATRELAFTKEREEETYRRVRLSRERRFNVRL